jgi:hypothetical protein
MFLIRLVEGNKHTLRRHNSTYSNSVTVSQAPRYSTKFIHPTLDPSVLAVTAINALVKSRWTPSSRAIRCPQPSVMLPAEALEVRNHIYNPFSGRAEIHSWSGFNDVRGWSEKFSASTTDGNTIDKIFSLCLYICNKHPCVIASCSIK